MTTATRKVELVAHTTCGLEFEIIDVETKESLTGGRCFWCSDDEIEWREEYGIEFFTMFIEQKGWELAVIAWS